MSVATYPVRVDGTLDPRVSRWLWLVKWLLVIPHYFVLAFLWLAFCVVSCIAFFAILFTGRYPRAVFDFNVGVLRWTWRVSYYSYGALATDRYPPFTLAEVPDYPTHFEVSYPEHLSRGLVLVKWWLLAIPHYIVVGIFVGGSVWGVWWADNNVGVFPGGLIGILVLVSAIVLGFTGRYPQQLFDFVLGLNRWVLRVAAYAGLMTDEYPPFRLDMGGSDPSSIMTLPVAGTQAGGVSTAKTTAPPPGAVPTAGTAPPAGGTPATGSLQPASAAASRIWTGGRVVSLVLGSLLALVSLGVLAGAGAATWADNSQRDAAGFLSTDTHPFSTPSYALTSDSIDLGTASDTFTPADLLGTVRIRATSNRAAGAVFIGVAPAAAVDRYLNGVNHAVVSDWTNGQTAFGQSAGGPPPLPPIAARFWTAHTAGIGTQSLTWQPTGGNWMVVVMNPSGRPGISISADAGATIPDLGWIAVALWGLGIVLAAGATALIVVPVVRASRASARASGR